MRLKKLLKTSLCAVFLMFMFTGCGSEDGSTGLKTGPTVTPIPTKATEPVAEHEFNYSDEEVNEVLDAVYHRALLVSPEYDFEITDEMITENLTKHDDGTSEVYVYDKSDNMLAVLMYDKDKNLYRAHINNYEGNVLISGQVYIDGVLAEYFETEDGTGSFRVDAEISEGAYHLSCISSKGEIQKIYCD